VSDCGGQLVRLPAAESSLVGAPLPPRERIEQLALAGLAPRADLHASVEYKRYMAGVLVADLLADLAREAGQ
jgi:CO/xanthine dehydrogenase FAD-binding subunit